MNETRTDERDLAAALGVTRATLRTLRTDSLEAGTHWERGHGGRIEYTAAGLERVREIIAESAPQNSPQEALEGAGGDQEPLLAEKTPPAPAGAAERPVRDIEVGQENAPRAAYVTRLPMNTRILFAYLWNEQTRQSDEILVRVRDNTKFVKGMEIPVLPAGPTAWQLARKHPRYKGKW